jgi:hypothetical protein
MSAPQCIFCRKGPADGVSLFRINAKGQPGVWACRPHMKRTDATIPEEVGDIVSIIEGEARKARAVR